ncbi:MAG TPA: glutaredoxin family protein [Candidatus Polarisedimenticolia bacterium]|nr:glutaredoxin family protein [Candidatus Polarisedimenticolia bacterium]
MIGKGTPEAVLYSRADCPLCYALTRTARRAARRSGLPLRILDVDRSEELRRLHGHEVPVLELPGGRIVRGRATPDEVEAAFRQAALARRTEPGSVRGSLVRFLGWLSGHLKGDR